MFARVFKSRGTKNILKNHLPTNIYGFILTVRECVGFQVPTPETFPELRQTPGPRPSPAPPVRTARTGPSPALPWGGGRLCNDDDDENHGTKLKDDGDTSMAFHFCPTHSLQSRPPAPSVLRTPPSPSSPPFGPPEARRREGGRWGAPPGGGERGDPQRRGAGGGEPPRPRGAPRKAIPVGTEHPVRRLKRIAHILPSRRRGSLFSPGIQTAGDWPRLYGVPHPGPSKVAPGLD